MRSAHACAWVSLRTTSGSPVTAPVVGASRTATVSLVLIKFTSTVPSIAAQPATPGLSGQVHTVETSDVLVMRCNRSALGVRSVTYNEPSTGSMHKPPPEPTPDSAVVGGA